MQLLQHTWALIRKDLLLEWRQKYALGGILLYVVSTTYMVYLTLGQSAGKDIEKQVWNMLFWITILFTAVNAIAKSFTQENRERNLYYYSLVSPQAVILAKMLYNGILMLLLTGICVAVFTVMIGSAVANWPLFAAVVFVGALGFSFVLTMISAIAAKAGNNATLMAVLSFPVLLPLILLLLKLSRFVFIAQSTWADISSLILAVSVLDLMMVAMSFILFPYLWRD